MDCKDALLIALVVLIIVHLYRSGELKRVCGPAASAPMAAATPETPAAERMASYVMPGAASPVVRGYEQVVTPERLAAREMMTTMKAAAGNTEGFDPDSPNQNTAPDAYMPAKDWSQDALLYYGAVDAQVIQNHKDFTSNNWAFNQNANWADWGDAQNAPNPRTGIWGFLINNVPTDHNPFQLSEDQDDGGAQRNLYTDKERCYGQV